jgi:peptide/nickel transport system ATP-binding protein
MPAEPPVLEIRELRVEYATPRGLARAVDGVSFTVGPGEVFGLVGESGSGKSTIAHAVLRLLPAAARIAGGQVRVEGVDVLALSRSELRAFRWRKASLVLQSALNALNPVLSVGEQLADVLKTHLGLSRAATRERAAALLERVGLERSRLDSYPHQLSGGMRQRVVIALALALQPPLMLLDEPTTALDVVVQREILRQLADLQQELGFAVLFISHDLSLLAELATRIGVMYAGELVELAPTAELLAQPRHPYVQGLMECFPSLAGPRTRIEGIRGSPPDPACLPPGCRFQPRCGRALPHCTERPAAVARVAAGHTVACHLY